jgi:hypothetical protein
VIGTARGSDTCSAVVNMLSHSQIDTLRTVSVVSDDASNMSGNGAGFVAFFTDTLLLPLYLSHCIVSHGTRMCCMWSESHGRRNENLH